MTLAPVKSIFLEEITHINHGFFTRNGGSSNGIYSSLNVRSSSNDNPLSVKTNRQKIADYFNISEKKLFFLNQQHYNFVNFVDENSEGRLDGDGLVTSLSGVGLCIITADCTPVLFADSKNKIIGACHAGWKGALSGIIENTLTKMVAIGAEKANIIAATGPCIGYNSYEVGEPFYNTFLLEDKNANPFFKNINNTKYFDLRAYVAYRIKRCGVRNIDVLPNDTCAESVNFFSYRRSFKNNEQDYGCQVSVIVSK